MNSKEILEKIRRLKIGDKIRINDWGNPMRVCGISEHFVLAHHGRTKYTILSKEPSEFSYNGVFAGDAYCGPDWWIFGIGLGDGYEFENPQWVERYMQTLESGETEISTRNRATIYWLGMTKEKMNPKRAHDGG